MINRVGFMPQYNVGFKAKKPEKPPLEERIKDFLAKEDIDIEEAEKIGFDINVVLQKGGKEAEKIEKLIKGTPFAPSR